MNVRMLDGTMMPAIVATMPSGPATPQPISATNRMFGPGAACAMAIDALNCTASIQPCSTTR